MTKDQQPAKRPPAQAKRPIGKVCFTCGGKGWTAPPWIKGTGPVRSECRVCHGKGRVTA